MFRIFFLDCQKTEGFFPFSDRPKNIMVLVASWPWSPHDPCCSKAPKNDRPTSLRMRIRIGRLFSGVGDRVPDVASVSDSCFMEWRFPTCQTEVVTSYKSTKKKRRRPACSFVHNETDHTIHKGSWSLLLMLPHYSSIYIHLIYSISSYPFNSYPFMVFF